MIAGFVSHCTINMPMRSCVSDLYYRLVSESVGNRTYMGKLQGGVDGKYLLHFLLHMGFSRSAENKKAKHLGDVWLSVTSGVDGTRTRGLRRDRPAL